ncbi:hypothetical protein HELRODRAFT_114062 [Helobdella robusta]|uniref:Guanylate cyclase n=1 Tax=Helobdella robusta TaxID=6412 RepID=T1EFY6_HELRO|nr:hypothetical protein HELRODRAFT_114062 [Helobdella robusta]ESN97917.1 hypothetical protein HELRODRAFT_114062 [Helobdella robusta]
MLISKLCLVLFAVLLQNFFCKITVENKSPTTYSLCFNNNDYLKKSNLTKIYENSCKYNNYYVNTKKKRDVTRNLFISKYTKSNGHGLIASSKNALLGKNKPEVVIAILAPNTTKHIFRLNLAHIAVDYARNTHPLAKKLFNEQCKLTVKLADTDCSQITAPILAYNFYKKDKIHVLFGPVCEYSLAPVARYARYWNLAVITPGGMSGFFGRDKTKADPEFPLLTRIGPTFDGVAKCLHTIMKEFHWDNVIMLVESDGGAHITPRLCNLVMTDIVFLFTQESIRYELYQIDVPEHVRNYSHILAREIGLEHSIIILCASPETVREIMIKAAEMHFNNGEYVFLNVDLFTNYLNNSLKPWHKKGESEERNLLAKKGFETLLTITMKKPESNEYKIFSKEIKRKAHEQYGEPLFGKEDVNSFVGAFHDAVILYALALNETLAEGKNISNGSDITRRMWNRTFEGVSGTVTIDGNGDRSVDYSLLDMNPDTGFFEAVAFYFGKKKIYEPIEGREIHWTGNLKVPPTDTPKCGYNNFGCPVIVPFPSTVYIAALSGLLFISILLATFFILRHYRLETELAEINWRIKWEDIMFGAPEKRRLDKINSQINFAKRESFASLVSIDSMVGVLNNLGCKQIFIKTGYYKSTLVAIKKIVNPINITKPLLIEFKRMRDLQNDHIVRFIGVCIDHGNKCIITEFCQKGSLQDVLENSQIKLDNMFKFSLMQDIIRGMSYLHSSDIKFHGNLKSSNCVVDSRFVLKITDFGLQSIRERAYKQDCDNYNFHKSKLWTAPELLINPELTCVESLQKCDVYSFAIICHEIVYRKGVFWIENEKFNAIEICRRVKMRSKPSCRPTLSDLLDNESYSEDLINIIKKCWNDEPFERPDFHTLKSVIKKINKEGNTGGNLLDNLLSRMEQYACNLEGLVEEKTSDYLKQKKRAEDLLYMMLPRSVAEQLMEGKAVEAVKFESVTIYFSDICGFTQLSAESSPMEVVDLLNDLYTTFDTIIEMLDVYKVETIGDAYMVVSGLPQPNGNLHAREISRMALKLLVAVRSFKIRHRPKDQLNLRIGIHSGPVCAGIVGRKMPRYCLFGDTVNTASRMESNGEPLKIHVSPDTKKLLDTFGTFQLKLRGSVTMKGKGDITTWWLLGENTNDYPELASKDVILNK